MSPGKIYNYQNITCNHFIIPLLFIRDDCNISKEQLTSTLTGKRTYEDECFSAISN